MRFFDLTGAPGRSTRAVSSHDRSSPEEQEKTIQRLSRRLAELEARTQQEGLEFELEVTAGSSYTVLHGLTGPYRWYVTYWKGAAGGAQFTEGASPAGALTLAANTTGRAVVRVEPSQYGLSP